MSCAPQVRKCQQMTVRDSTVVKRVQNIIRFVFKANPSQCRMLWKYLSLSNLKRLQAIVRTLIASDIYRVTLGIRDSFDVPTYFSQKITESVHT